MQELQVYEVQVYRHTGRFVGMQELTQAYRYRSTGVGIQAYRCRSTGLQVYRYTCTQVHRHTGTEVQVD